MLALWNCGRRAGVVQAQRQIHRAFAGQLRRRLRTSSSQRQADPPYPLAPPRKIGRNKSDEAVGGSALGSILPIQVACCQAFISVSSLGLVVAQLSCWWFGAGVACSV